MTRIIGTIEARMGSSRLPGKTMNLLHNGMSLLECVVRRFQKCNMVADVVVATTITRGDDIITEWCEKNHVPIFRGSEENVLDRVVGAAQQYGADAIVQMGADSAYLDYLLIDQLVAHYLNGNFDFVCNSIKLTYPLGIYGHVVRVEKLVALNQRNDLSEKDKSDVVRYIWEHPETYAISNVEAPVDFHYPELRLTIDYPEDLEQAKNVYTHLGLFFTTRQVIDLYLWKPELFEKTRSLIHKSAPHLSLKS